MILETVSYESLMQELDRLGNKYEYSEVALEVIQAVMNWAIEETVPNQ